MFKVQGSSTWNLEPGTWNLERVTPGARRLAPGVTLVEMIIVIAITGILAAAVAVFIRRPVEGYVDAARRAELSDIADTALRRITRDLRTALPNSIRVDGTGMYIEYLQTVGGGRYRSDVDSGGGGEPLNFNAPDSTFDVIGPMPDSIAAGNLIAIYNLGAGTGSTDAYTGGNTTTVSSVAAPTINIASMQFPFSSPGKRFQVVQYPVTYACESGVLRRYWSYAISPAQPVPPAGASTALLATNVGGCSFSYATVGASGRTGVVAISLQISQGGETVRLFQQVHVSNVP